MIAQNTLSKYSQNNIEISGLFHQEVLKKKLMAQYDFWFGITN